MALRLDEWRRVRGLSRKEVASRIGVSCVTIENWEKAPGKVTMYNAHKLARVYGIEVEDIIFLP